jgi:serine/threonine protein kinase/tetratricopeptide (TPR) repeat protein
MTEREAFLEALEMETPAARAAYLKGACAGDVALQRKVERLLEEHFSNDSLLAGSALAGDRPGIVESPVEEAPAPMLGRYKLLEKIGEGGFGEVWMAEQREPVKRRVALKILKPGMDSRQIVARFEAERQALAMMDHANVAKIFDAGTTDTGRPYFVMELVRGMKITDYCDQSQLPTRERLRLFILVCQAIQHAHQKGIIHRDIKPSNILVTLHDGVPVPKVIDFGIAKATQQELTDKTVFTQFQQFMGTPAYTSPEQAEMSGLDIDTRADIYSLGVLLYELLVGQTPFDAKEMMQGGLDALRQIIREKEPLRPSTKLNTLQGDARTTAGRCRQTDVRNLVHQLQGDLDWIVIKCLEKDRTRRYETANGLAMDIDRYLKNEPVIARPPSRLYEFQKTVRRHKVGFAAAGAVLLSLAVGLGIATWTLVKEKKARDRAVAAEQEQARLRKKAEANENTAKIEAAKSDQVAQFMKDMLQSVEPSVALGRDTTMLREILDATSKRLKNLHDQPAVEAELCETLGTVYCDLGEYANSELMHRQSLALRQKLPRGDDVDVADSLNHLADSLWRQGKLAEAENVQSEALRMRRELLGPEHLDLAESLDGMANVVWRLGKLNEAETLQRQALEMRRKLLGNEHKDVATTIDSLAAILWTGGKLDQAAALAREGLDMHTRLFGEEHPNIAISLNNLGNILRDQHQLAQAEAAHAKALAIRRKLLDQEHPFVAISLFNLADVLCDEGKFAEAEPLARECLTIREKKTPDHWRVFSAKSLLGGILLARKQYVDAEPLLLAGYKGMKQREDSISIDGKMHPREALQRLARLYEEMNRPDQAAEWKQKLADFEARETRMRQK